MEKSEIARLATELESAMSLFRRKDHSHDGKFGLKHSEVFFLLTAGEKTRRGGVITPSDFAKEFGVTMSAITHHINSLEQKGLIERAYSGEDRRVIFVRLSEEGQKILIKLKKQHHQTLHSLIEFLGEEDAKKLISIISRINEFKERVNDQTN